MAPNVGLKAAWTTRSVEKNTTVNVDPSRAIERNTVTVKPPTAATVARATRRRPSTTTIADVELRKSHTVGSSPESPRSDTGHVINANHRSSLERGKGRRRRGDASSRTSSGSRQMTVTDRDVVLALFQGESAVQKTGQRPPLTADRTVVRRRPHRVRTAAKDARTNSRKTRAANQNAYTERARARSRKGSRHRRGKARRSAPSSSSSRSSERERRVSSRRASRNRNDRDKPSAEKQRRSPTPMPKRPHK